MKHCGHRERAPVRRGAMSSAAAVFETLKVTLQKDTSKAEDLVRYERGARKGASPTCATHRSELERSVLREANVKIDRH